MKEVKIMRNEVNRAHKAKKALRYLLILVAMLSVLSLSAQNLAQQPSSDFRSTSVMMGTGSTLPQAAQTGTVTTYDVPSSPKHPGHIRRAGEDDGFENEGEEPATGNPGEPAPIGDAAWPLALCMMAYVCVRAFRRKRA